MRNRSTPSRPARPLRARWHVVPLLLAAVSIASCGPKGAPTGKTSPASTTPPPATPTPAGATTPMATDAGEAEPATYGQTLEPGRTAITTADGALTEALRVALERARPGAHADGALSEACREYLERKVFLSAGEGHADFEVFRYLLWRQGVIDAAILPYRGRFATPERAVESASAIVNQLLAVPFNRWGIATQVGSKGEIDVAILVTHREVALAAIPREQDPGATVSLSVWSNRSRPARLLVQQPDGRTLESRFEIGEKPGQLRFPLDRKPGRYDVEVVFLESTGPVIAASFPLLVGERFPDRYVGPKYEVQAGALTESAIEARLATLVNRTRVRYGLPPVTVVPALARLARAHSQEMRRVGFGRQSAEHGSLASRLQREKIVFRDATELVASGVSAEALHATLLSSPTYRLVLLDARLTHFGAGVAPQAASDRAGTLYATAVLASLVEVRDPATLARSVLATINERRKREGAAPLSAEAGLAAVAARHAAAMARHGTPAYEVPGSSLVKEAKAAAKGAKALGAFVGVLSAESDAVEYTGLYDPAMQRVGIGVVQADSKEYGPGALWLTVVVVR